jgi:nicotinamidase-related amidase
VVSDSLKDGILSGISWLATRGAASIPFPEKGGDRLAFETVVIDIDTQWDLVMPEGAWPVPGAYGLMPNLERVIRYARMYNLPVFSTVQVRSPDDPRFTAGEGAEPPHCLRGTPGAAKVAATRPVKAVTIENRAYSGPELQGLTGSGREIVVETSGPDLLSNPNTAHILAGAKSAIVFGFPMEGAVSRAVQWLLNQGVAVEVVQNATSPRSEDPEARESLLADWIALGARKIRDIDIMTRFTTSRHR